MGVLDAAFGSIDNIEQSGAFKDFPKVGMGLGELLMQRLRTPVTDTQEFQFAAGSIQDFLTQQSAGARQRFGDAASAGGFLDSGAVDRGLLDISCLEMDSLQTSLRDLILGFEGRKVSETLPFLGLGNQEYLGVAGMNLQGQIASRAQNVGLATSAMSSFSPM